MLRGAQKQMIVIRTHNSRLFEEAYFVVRKPRAGRVACKEDMLWEANRIIERSLAAAPDPAAEIGSRTAVATLSEAVTEAEGQPSHGGLRGRLRGRGILRGLWFSLGVLCGGGAACLLQLLL